jgi:hypothetical protein
MNTTCSTCEDNNVNSNISGQSTSTIFEEENDTNNNYVDNQPMSSDKLFNSSKYFENILNYSKLNILGIIGLAVIALLIAFFSFKDYFKSVVTISIATFITWLGHLFMHCENKYNILYKIHQITHHSPFAETMMGKLFEYTIMEFIFFGGGLLLIFIMLIHKFWKIYLLNPYVLFFWAISVPLVHEIYYHSLKISDLHKTHHANQSTGYSPDYWDVIFQTKKHNSPFEKEYIMIPFLVIIACLVILGIDTPVDFIKKLS